MNDVLANDSHRQVKHIFDIYYFMYMT